MSINNFLLFLFVKVCTSYVVVVWQILSFLSLHINYIKFIYNQEKFKTRSNKLKVHRANSQTKSLYLVRFFTDISFSSLVSFTFCLLVIFVFFFLKLKIYILIHIRLYERMSNKTFFTRPVSGNKTTFFGLIRSFWFCSIVSHTFQCVFFYL